MTTLYRFLDHDGQLLYVGITDVGPARWRSHQAGQPWWRDVAEVDLVHYDTREEARAAELDAIRREAPLHNKADRRVDVQDMRQAVSRVVQEWVALLDGEQTLVKAAAAASLAETARAMAHEAAIDARVDGASYADVADALGMTRQGARKRYGHLEAVQ